MKIDLDIPAIEDQATRVNESKELGDSVTASYGLYLCKTCRLAYSYRAAEGYQWNCCGDYLVPVFHPKEHYDC